MTVTSSTNVATGNGNDVTTIFPFSFKTKDADHIKAWIIDSYDNETTLVKDTDYTVSLNADGTGNVTYPISGSPLPTGSTITIKRVVPYKQETDLKNQGPYNAETVEIQMDLLTHQTQQLAEADERTLKKRESDGSSGGEYDATSSNIINVLDPIGGNDAANKQWVEEQVNAVVSGAVAPNSWVITANGGTTYTISGATVAQHIMYDVWVGGVHQKYSTDYTIDVGITPSQIVFSSSITSGTEIFVIERGYNKAIPSDGNYTPPFAGAQTRSITSRLSDFISVKDFGAVGDGVTDDTIAIQAAIDYAHSQYNDSDGVGGKTVFIPAGTYLYVGVTIKPGVSLQGEGMTLTELRLSGLTATGIKCAAATTQSYVDQVTYGKFSDIAFLTATSAPTSQVAWNMTGFSRWTLERCLFYWFGGLTAIQCVNATPASLSGPAQWYNMFIDCFFIRGASHPNGGIAIDLGDTDAAKEQVTTLTMVGGHISGADPAKGGTGIALRGTGNRFFGVTFEGNGTAISVGSSGTRGAESNVFFGCYWEGNTVNRLIYVNALYTQFEGSFLTGGTDNDGSSTTIYFDPGKYQTMLLNGGAYNVVTQDPSVKFPTYKSLTGFVAVSLQNSVGTDMFLCNQSAASSADSYFSVLPFSFGASLFKCGFATATLQATTLYLNNSTTLGVFSGAASPEGVVTANPGAVYLRTGGGASTSFYVKETGTGNTGWVAK